MWPGGIKHREGKTRLSRDDVPTINTGGFRLRDLNTGCICSGRYMRHIFLSFKVRSREPRQNDDDDGGVGRAKLRSIRISIFTSRRRGDRGEINRWDGGAFDYSNGKLLK